VTGDEGLRGYVPLATHLNQCFSLRTLPRGGPGPGRHFEERARFDDLAQAVEQATDENGQPLHRFVLLGEPGAGKSTALRKLALQTVRARLADPAAPFPLFVRLSDHRTGSPAEFLAAEWQRTYGDDAWRQVLSPGQSPLRIWLFADGLNEMSPDGYHDRVAAWRRFLRDELPHGNRALVACRVADYGDALALPRLQIQPLDPERIRTFLRNYLPDRADDLWRDLLKDRQRHGDEHSLYGLAANPFWLTMIVAVYSRWGLPEGHAELIEHFVDEWLMYEAERPGGRAYSPDEAEAFKQAVARLAYSLLERGQNVPQPLGEALVWLPEEVDVDGRPVAMPSDETLPLAEAINLVVAEGERPGARTLRFYHQLLLEHFAGREMARRLRDGEDQSVHWRIPWRNWQFVDSEWDPLPPPPTTGWEEATALAAACAARLDPEHVEELTRAVLSHHPPLAARCLLEAGLISPGFAQAGFVIQPSDRQIEGPAGAQAVLLRLLEVVRGQTPPGLQPDQALSLRIACGLALGHLGDPRILQGESHTPDGVRFIQPRWSQVVGAGPFLMGSDRGEEGAYDDEYSAATSFQRHQVDIPYDYRIGLYPVTNAEYRCFIEDGGYEKEGYWQTEAARRWLRGQADLEPTLRFWRYWADMVRRDPDVPDYLLRENLRSPQEVEFLKWLAAADDEELVALAKQAVGQTGTSRAPRFWDDRAYNNPSQPVVGVCWYEAMAYCAWLTERINESRIGESANQQISVRLPTEAEWEKAARWDGKRGRRYPWGDRWDEFQCNSLEGRVLTTTPVGIYPDGASFCGALDMAGNVWEWTRSLWGPEIERPAFDYPYNPGDGREDEESGDLRVVRGGAFGDASGGVRCAFRNGDGPNFRLGGYGFRVVVAPVPSDL
jgi:formylglycine-generating enzyme required for sulfatase activity